MAAPDFSAGEFEKWLYERLDGLGADREVYGAYILGVLHEEDSEEERSDALSGILSAFVDEETLEEVCQQILKQWAECCSQNAGASNQLDGSDRGQAEGSVRGGQAEERSSAGAVRRSHGRRRISLKRWKRENVVPLFKNTNVEDVLNRRRQQREQAKEGAQKKKEQDKMQREKDKLTKQERKEREKKRTQKGERKR
ncbi:coiled-coil domain-containing protein 43 [Silurus meridionalis]|nr:coiled-coil domain-containing protein 43 [Silurus meridionalis]